MMYYFSARTVSVPMCRKKDFSGFISSKIKRKHRYMYVFN